MRNVSRKYIEAMSERRDFYAAAEITFSNSQKITLGKKDFTLSGNSYSDSAESSSFPLGLLISKRINLSLINDDDRWSDYDFYGAKIFLQTKFDLDDGTVETLNIGTFTVVTPENYGTTVVITAMDDGYKADQDYATTLSYPASAGQVLLDSCQTCGITLLTSSFPDDDYMISSMPENITHRKLIGMIAMIAGGNAVFDEYSRLIIKPYDLSPFGINGLDGGIFDITASGKYKTGDVADGGDFTNWDVKEAYDGGRFGDRDNVHILYQFRSGLKVDVDDVVITGVQLTDDNKTAHLYGSDGYVLSLENLLANGKEDAVAKLIGEKIVGLRFRPFSGDHIALPTVEFMDLAYIMDWKNNVYQTLITDVDFTYFGFTSLKCSANSPIRNSSKYYNNETKTIVEARRLVNAERTARELAVQNLATQLSKSSGLYMTEIHQDDGSTVYYMHDKPTLEESMIVWKLTAEAFGVSTDGGKTYPYGFDATGVAILERIYAIGIDADHITAGAITVRDASGNIILSADIGSKRVQMSGWQVSNQAIYKDITGSDGKIYRVYFQAPVASAPAGTWVLSCQQSDGEGKPFYGNFVLFSDGSARFGNGLNETPITTISSDGKLKTSSAEITGGSLNIKTASESYSAVQLQYSTSSISELSPSHFFTTMYNNGVYKCIGIGTASIVMGLTGGIDSTTMNKIGLMIVLDDSGQATFVTGGSKSRVIDTHDFGRVLQYCYETASPMFGDIGSGRTDDEGMCYIYFDPVFSETISTDCNYQVFLQKEGKGDIWISEKHQEYFVVCGTPNLLFSWEAKAKQRDYEYERMEAFNRIEDVNADIDYTAAAEEYLNNYEKEILDYEEINQFYVTRNGRGAEDQLHIFRN